MTAPRNAESSAGPRTSRDPRHRPLDQLVVLAATVLVALGGCAAAEDRTSADSRTTMASTASSTPTTVAPEDVTPDQLCPGTGSVREDAQALATCVAKMVSHYWTSVVGESVQATIVAAPVEEAVSEECLGLLALGTGFYCSADNMTYITGTLLDYDIARFGAAFPYAVAAVVVHEFGHVVQAVVGQPGLDDPPSPELARAFEQQADCSVGVWATDAAGAGRVNPTAFRAAYEQELALVVEITAPADPGVVSDEVLSHGTVEERMVAYDTGFTAATGTACGLVGIA